MTKGSAGGKPSCPQRGILLGGMPQENVETVRAGFDAYNRGDLDALTETYDPDVEFVTLLLGNHRGRDAIRVIYEENREALAGYRLDPVEVFEAGEDQVVAVARLGGAGQSSQISLPDRMAFVFTINDGLLVRQESFRSKEEALAAVGLSE
jgi:ketosteroid isomerase-like protein